METATQTIDLQPFCAEKEGRYALAQSWVFEGYKYATNGNGKILVRIPTDESNTEYGIGDAGKTLFTPDPRIRAGWPEQKYKCAIVDCVEEGCAHGKKLCECCGQYTMECDKCEGRGEIYQNVIQLGIAFVAMEYDLKIRALPSVTFSIPLADEGRKGVRFYFHGGDGIVMPRTDSTEWR